MSCVCVFHISLRDRFHISHLECLCRQETFICAPTTPLIFTVEGWNYVVAGNLLQPSFSAKVGLVLSGIKKHPRAAGAAAAGRRRVLGGRSPTRVTGNQYQSLLFRTIPFTVVWPTSLAACRDLTARVRAHTPRFY